MARKKHIMAAVLLWSLVFPQAVLSQPSSSHSCSLALAKATNLKHKGALVRIERHMRSIKKHNRKCHRVMQKLAPKTKDLPRKCSTALKSKWLNSRAKAVIAAIFKEIGQQQSHCTHLLNRLATVPQRGGPPGKPRPGNPAGPEGAPPRR